MDKFVTITSSKDNPNKVSFKCIMFFKGFVHFSPTPGLRPPINVQVPLNINYLPITVFLRYYPLNRTIHKNWPVNRHQPRMQVKMKI